MVHARLSKIELRNNAVPGYRQMLVLQNFESIEWEKFSQISY
ncbi:hypothetical protein BLL52_0660 [Rhodoferax antarcticus ANT.BR]|uniref:Uncharacterized protein n=1 Tax=Rhodoferax antarcticus ANT.BR TaxID=1111071 RepID=A0A1Q8YJ13_9BURK|nr:hypothetical protein BLL52_0660 [Rhodoferax antarcticus ANT.BR]